jgi:WD40 repeat protein
MAGCADGKLRMYDLRRQQCIASWASNFSGEIGSVLMSVDETSCYSLSTDGKMECWSLTQTGRRLWEFPLNADEKLGPFYDSEKGRLMQPKMKNRTNLAALDNDGHHMLIGSNTGGTIYTINEQGLERIMELKGHKAPVVAVDWSVAMNCGTCATGSLDGRVKISTLLSP